MKRHKDCTSKPYCKCASMVRAASQAIAELKAQDARNAFAALAFVTDLVWRLRARELLMSGSHIAVYPTETTRYSANIESRGDSVYVAKVLTTRLETGLKWMVEHLRPAKRFPLYVKREPNHGATDDAIGHAIEWLEEVAR